MTILCLSAGLYNSSSRLVLTTLNMMKFTVFGEGPAKLISVIMIMLYGLSLALGTLNWILQIASMKDLFHRYLPNSCVFLGLRAQCQTEQSRYFPSWDRSVSGGRAEAMPHSNCVVGWECVLWRWSVMAASAGVGQGSYVSNDVEMDGWRVIWVVGTECHLGYLWETEKTHPVIREQ